MFEICVIFFVCVLYCDCIVVDGIASFVEKPDGQNEAYYFAILDKLNGEAEFPSKIIFEKPLGNIFYMTDRDQCYIYYPQRKDFDHSEITLQVKNCSNIFVDIGVYTFIPSLYSESPIILDVGSDGEGIFGVIGYELVEVTLNSTTKNATITNITSLNDYNCDIATSAVFALDKYFIMCDSGYRSTYFMVFDSKTWEKKGVTLMNNYLVRGIQYFQGSIYGVYTDDKGGSNFGYFDADSPSLEMTSLVSFEDIRGFLGTAIHTQYFYAFIAGQKGKPPYDLGYYFFVYDLLKGKTVLNQRIFDDQDYRYDVGMFMKYIYFAG